MAYRLANSATFVTLHVHLNLKGRVELPSLSTSSTVRSSCSKTLFRNPIFCNRSPTPPKDGGLLLENRALLEDLDLLWGDDLKLCRHWRQVVTGRGLYNRRRTNSSPMVLPGMHGFGGRGLDHALCDVCAMGRWLANFLGKIACVSLRASLPVCWV